MEMFQTFMFSCDTEWQGLCLELELLSDLAPEKSPVKA